MSNPYYTAPAIPVDYSLARAGPIRGQYAAIEAAFDKLYGRTSFLVAGGTANALTVEMAVPPEAYEEGLLLYVKITETNTDVATLNVNGLGPIEIVTRVNDPLIAGDLIEGSVETFFYVENDGNQQFMIREVAGAQGPIGPQGPPDGPPGDSAYEVAVANGFVGTEAEWLASLQGEDGTPGNTVLYGADVPDAGDGVDGNFYVRTNATLDFYGPKALGAWPAPVSLVGTDGDDGLSAYEVAVANGFVGSEAAWLASLEGPPGADGAGSTWADLGGKPENLTDFAALVGATGKMIYFSSANVLALTDSTAYGRSLLNMANAAAVIASLGSVSVQEFSPGSPGYLRLNCAGVIFTIMWGVSTANANGSTTFTYPDGGFSSFSVPVGSAIGDIDTDAQHNQASVQSATRTQFSVYSAANMARPFFWIAVGI